MSAIFFFHRYNVISIVKVCIFLLLFKCASAEPLINEIYSGVAHDALYSIDFDEKFGIAVGAAGLVLKSDDGGDTWIKLSPAITEMALLDVITNRGKSIIVGQMGGIFVSSDNSKWTKVESHTDSRLMSVDMNDSGFAVTVGGFGTILFSTDYGYTWNTVAIDWESILNDFIEPHLYDVSVSSTNKITVVGEFELILDSADGGKNWVVENKAESSLFALSMTDESQGIAVGQNGTILLTRDGHSWQRLNSKTDANLLGVKTLNQETVLISGIHSMLFSKNSGQTWQNLSSPDIATAWYQSVTVPPTMTNTQNDRIAFFAVGHSGRILKIEIEN